MQNQHDPLAEEDIEDIEEEDDGEGVEHHELSTLSYESQQSSSQSEALSWIAYYCSCVGHEYFAEVQEDFIEDDFNLTGLSALVPYYKEALEMILDIEPEDWHAVPDTALVENSAELLYGLIHQRYVVSRQGIQQMYDKYEAGHFGYCPRVFCNQTQVVPCGRSDLPRLDTVKLYCPNCFDIYIPPNSRFQRIDGAFFGTTFPHLFFKTYPELVPIPSTKVYEPKIFGFRVSGRAKSGPRMSWLRMRPPIDSGNNDDEEKEEEEIESEEMIDGL
ncbi:Casein kinase II subunit beta-1 [Neolecta irregularis DAH-3]|uniref:Casein kinase II subunit beta n=1 Tax=Neolecta irregularis (strain DAH-3) TaxID=1198029 RepID=A0A1U7LVV4_NEOID|nr:Casein kinase II subunit beta-1 [Neolecta irregularis DAH-3]|eukprot:OLL26703.1 Casein kinase II subunit beta-1 [Neolecta irregularis DAH-3]